MNNRPKDVHEILVVDDNHKNLSVLDEILSHEGYTVRVALHGKQALKILEKFLPDLILLDGNMPEMDGFETCRAIKKEDRFHHIPVIFLSALTEQERKIDAFNAGAVDYITKPFFHKEVLARVSLQLKLSDTQKRLKEESDFKMEILSMATHQLNNDLGVMLAISQTGTRALLNKDFNKAQTSMKAIEERGLVMATTLREFITLARNSLESIKPTLSVFSVRELFDGVIQLETGKTSHGRIKTTYHLATDSFYSDTTMLKHILGNLLGNALKYSPEESDVLLDVSLIENLTQKRLTVKVTDHGVGIPENEQDRIFTLFNRCSNVGSIPGSGVGLSLVKKFVESLGGTIAVESKKNTHTTFKFDIPAISRKQG